VNNKFDINGDSSVGIATGYGLDGPGAVPGGARFFSSPQCPDQLWGPPNLLLNGYLELFPWGKISRDMKLITRLHHVPRSRKVELYPHSPYVFIT
jgi:hypothetical protein